MAAPIICERDVEFMLYELFDAQGLVERPRYSDHSRETFEAALDTARTVAQKYLMPLRQKADVEQPEFNGDKVVMIPEIKAATDALIESGLASATADFELGGMQLPGIVSAAVYAYLTAAGSTVVGYSGLTTANANLIDAHGTPEQKEKWVKPMRTGRFAGTMAMSEPGAGSGLADLTTSAVKNEQGNYRISGNKIWISGGDHELNENIVHLVLARVRGAPQGVKGISLFIVPKYLVNDDGSIGERNDVALAGLFHKMGGRGQTSTALNFGENGGAVGYLVGEENKGLAYMFHMMNEARIMVGSSAASTALTGYQYSLDYARERMQGRLPSCKDPSTPPVSIIEHADVRRMLLAQKVYAEGAFALCLYGSQLADDERTAATEEEREHAHRLLDTLTPVIKTWPSEYGPRANSLAMQVMGGAGYVNEHPVEMFYRDNRLNPIHEGTTGIQSLDLLARKVPMNNFSGYKAVLAEMEATISQISNYCALATYGTQLQNAIDELKDTTDFLFSVIGSKDIDLVLANSVKYLDVFGNVVIAWLWLRQGMVAERSMESVFHEQDKSFYQGKLQAMRFFFHYELPEIYHWCALLKDLDSVFYDMQPDWF
jgi:butyryl-CoA dehydrogenase